MSKIFDEFINGKSINSYEYFGCHINCDSTTFRVYAPKAISVSVVGTFNGWDAKKHAMKKAKNGVFELVVDKNLSGEKYKYYIQGENKKFTFKSDPYAKNSEYLSSFASICSEKTDFKWTDKKYIESLEKTNKIDMPINIYEVNIGSYKRHSDGSVYTYEEFADEIIEYVKNLNYTHIEIMPITEFPCDSSWGYQVTGYFSVTTRYGDMNGLKYLINKCHENNIGVIMDFVPAHFCKDEHGLVDFDGGALYEYDNNILGEHKNWGTRVFDYSKGYVQSFLISSAMYFLKEFHFDGLRMDAVASMLMLDFDRQTAVRNKIGGIENLEAISFLKNFNELIHKNAPWAITVAEDSTPFPYVTKTVDNGGLGFDFKWNMGFMNDSLVFFSSSDRKLNINSLLFPFSYAKSENYILPISHDEVVHGKGSLVNKMPGEVEDKFDNLRLYYMMMTSFIGKKLLFMGSEFAQFKEWNFNTGIDHDLLLEDKHYKTYEYLTELNKIYKQYPAFYTKQLERDFSVKEINNLVVKFSVDDKYHCYCNFSQKNATISLDINTDEYNIISTADKKYGATEDFTMKKNSKGSSVVLPKNSGILFYKS